MNRKKGLLLLFKKKKVASAPSFTNISIALQNTTITNDLAADGYSWSQAHPLLFDSHGNMIALAQRRNGGNSVHGFVFKNVNGNWQDAGFTEGFLARASVAIDTTNNVLHVLWNALDPSDGVIYRRYTISYSGNTISGITKDTNVNLQMDFQLLGSMQYEHPVMLFLNDAAYGTYGAIVAIWSARNTGVGGTGNEIRSSLCVLNATADRGKLAINWAAVTTISVSTIGNIPAVVYSALVTNTTTAIIYHSISRISSKDLVLFYFDGGAVRKLYYRRAIWSSANNNWSDGLTSAQLVSNLVRAGTDSGYNLKDQLGTKIVQDTDGNTWFGFANWKSNSAGDTVSIVSVKDDVLSSLIDVYSVNGAHSYAPCVDIETWGKHVLVSYITTTNQYVYCASYKGTALSKAPALLFDDAPCDIPLIEALGNTLYILFRDTVNTPTPPYHGWAGTIEL